MKFLSNAHTHTTYCDGLSDIKTTVLRAQELGFVSLGFSGHAHQGFDPKYSMSAQGQQAYVDELRTLQALHATRGITPKLYLGVEQDALALQERKDINRRQCDYIIGSAHYLAASPNADKEAVDGSREALTRFVREVFAGDAVEMAKAYYKLLGNSIRQDKPDIIGHFDVVRKHAAVIGLNTDDPAYRRAALNALETAYRGCTLLEVNTGNIARGYDTLPYPADFLLRAWREMGGKVTLTSDCHNAKDLDCAYPLALDYCKRMGFESLYRLGTGDALWDEVAL